MNNPSSCSIKGNEILIAGIQTVIMTLLLALPVSTYAQITLNSADRRVSAVTRVDSSPVSFDSELHSTAATGGFDSQANANSSGKKPGCSIFCFTSTASAQASQSTDLTVLANSLVITGQLNTFTFTDEGSFLSGPAATATASSSVELIFNLLTTAHYEFSILDGSAHLTMRNLDTSALVLFGNTLPFVGDIGAGNYEFDFFVDNALGSSNNADFSFAVSTIPVPEPEIYALMLAGLGLLGFAARRRKQNAG